MRKLILSTLAAISLSLPMSGCLEDKLEENITSQEIETTQRDIELGSYLAKKLDQSSEGFSQKGVFAIALAEIEVSKKYNLPMITYSEREYVKRLAAKEDSILCAQNPNLRRSDIDNLIELNAPFWHPTGQYLLVMDNFQKHQEIFFTQEHYRDNIKKPMDERFSVPHLYPMVAQTIHNMGHIYFSMIGIEKQVDLAMCFQYLDYHMYEKTEEKIIGHPSLLSHYSSIPWGDRVDARYALTNTDDQFAETFVYHVLNHTYKDDDELFQKRLEVVKESLELFAKN